MDGLKVIWNSFRKKKSLLDNSFSSPKKNVETNLASALKKKATSWSCNGYVKILLNKF